MYLAIDLGWVWTNAANASRFNGFNARGKPLKRLGSSLDAGHPVEAGANESGLALK
jgi:hypothetical protein